MSSVTMISREVGPDGVLRYRTKYKVLVHSHNSNGVIDLSNSVVKVSSGKNIKSVGNLSITLVADRNTLNRIYPNDYINVYVDRGDGQGKTRQFFGFVDQIEESSSTASNGSPTTVYSLQCSDFSKAPERTQIYFNPQIAGRADFTGGFVGTPNLGGMSLMTRGILMNGSPADMVVNVMLLLMGFGSQFTLPSCYNPRMVSLARQKRADFLVNRLSEDARRAVLDDGGYADFLERIRRETGTQSSVSELTDPGGVSASSVQEAERARFSSEVIAQLGGTGSGVGVQGIRLGNERGIEAYNALNTTLAGYPPTLLDVIDIFTFVEREAMDGYYTGASMWERQGSVTSFLRYITNEIVNELYFDLRPISRGGGLIAGTDYSRDLDEIGGNEGVGGVPNGIQYAPALVMREYPFSTLDRLDGTGIPLSMRGSAANGVAPQQPNLGRLYFGAIFSDQPAVPGRHIVTIPNINPGDLSEGRTDIMGTKHLDVATVYDTEIMSTKFTRSDSDHHNLLEIISDAMVGNAGRFYMQDLLPIITPIHIVRHGLRVRSLQTRAARFPPTVTNRLQEQPTPAQAEESAPSAPAPEPTPTNSTVLPVELEGSPGAYSQGFVTRANQWWYRPKTFDGRRPVNNVDGNPVPSSGVRYWRFHNGVDVHAPRGTPVRAVRDGKVVMAAPVGTRGRAGYGNCIVIHHEQDNMYSVYAHLQDFAENLRITSRSRWLAHYASADFHSNGTFTPVTVRAGDIIGHVGDTDCPGAVHLHFEFNVPRGATVFPSSSDRSRLTPDFFRDASTALSGYQQSSSLPSNPDESATISQDPVRVMREVFGITWPVQRVDEAADPVAPDADPAPAEMYPGDEAEDVTDQDHQVPPTPTAASAAPDTVTTTVTQSGYVDTPDVRRQVARWALLNDHWYQHNLEYLSGTVEMRGAPEIRVGYRLDLVDRNLSFYVEGVNHNWSYGQHMTTTLHVTRGQPNNPYPAYVLPYINGFDPTATQRQTGSRLAKYFIVPDPIAVRRGLKLERINRGTGIDALPMEARTSLTTNMVDMPNEGGTLVEKYDEQILPAVSVSIPIDLAQEMEREQQALGLRGAGSSLSAVQTNPQGGISDDVVSEMFPSTDIGSL